MSVSDLPVTAIGWVQLACWPILAAATIYRLRQVARVAAVAYRLEASALRLEIMADQAQEMVTATRKTLQAARVLPADRIGIPAPSTWPPRVSDPTVIALDRRRGERRRQTTPNTEGDRRHA